MKKLKEWEIVDYVDGTLDTSRLAEVEEHLRHNAEDRELVATMKAAMGALHDLDEANPITVSSDFWVKVREQLPAAPPRRSPLRALGAMLWPSQSRLQFSARIAVVAAFLAMAASMLMPRDNVNPVVANNVPADAKQFIQRSLDQHAGYVPAPSSGGTLPAIGDGRSVEAGGQDDSEERLP